jgi:hypothetical protein
LCKTFEREDQQCTIKLSVSLKILSAFLMVKTLAVSIPALPEALAFSRQLKAMNISANPHIHNDFNHEHPLTSRYERASHRWQCYQDIVTLDGLGRRCCYHSDDGLGHHRRAGGSGN